MSVAGGREGIRQPPAKGVAKHGRSHEIADALSKCVEPSPLPQMPPSDTYHLGEASLSPRLARVAMGCQESLRYGMDLASRGATFSARAEFTDVLNRVAQTLDVEHDTDRYSQALSAGMRAAQESGDFRTGDQRLSTDIDIGTLVAMHQTSVLKAADTTRIKPIVARQIYFDYAKRRLEEAAGGQRIASQALYGLARLETVEGAQKTTPTEDHGPRAIALYQAALLVDPENVRAANELGVLFARYGQLDHARSIFVHSTTISDRPETWHNLAKVLEKQGDTVRSAHARAQRARTEAEKPKEVANEARQVYWVSPEAFADSSDPLLTRTTKEKNAADGAVKQASTSADSDRSSRAWSLASPLRGWGKLFNHSAPRPVRGGQ